MKTEREVALKQNWRDRALSPEDAVRLIVDGHHVFLHGGCTASFPLEAELAERAQRLSGLTVYQLHKEGAEALAARYLAGKARIHSWFCGAGIRDAIAEGRAKYLPVFLSDIPHYLRNRIFPLDVAVIQVSPPDAHGYCSLGVSLDVARQAVRSAEIVLTEVNERMPRTHGDSLLHLDDVTAFIATDRPLAEHVPAPLTPESELIGHHVASLVEDGATLQFGIGSVAEAVVASLFEKRDMGLHTEMFSDSVDDLVQAGVVTGRRKTLHEGVIITSFVVGTKKVFDFVNDNPSVEFHPSDYTNDTAIIRRHDRMSAINGALQVDLTGQVAADSIGGRVYSGIGGQMDFVRGAALAPEGRAIIALPSTAKGGTVSRIAPVIDPGAGVVTTRGHVQYIVTEYGTADLRGKSLRERAESLIGIAHPDFRVELRAHLRHSTHSIPARKTAPRTTQPDDPQATVSL